VFVLWQTLHDHSNPLEARALRPWTEAPMRRMLLRECESIQAKRAQAVDALGTKSKAVSVWLLSVHLLNTWKLP
jgi:hypothetical protein